MKSWGIVAALAAGVAGCGGGGVGNDLAVPTCTASFSGAVSGSSSCAVTLLYLPSSNEWTASTGGNTIAGTTDTWSGFNFVGAGMPAVGTWNQTSSVGASTQLVGQGSAAPYWVAGYGSSGTYGTATLTITALGDSSIATGESTLYSAASGTWTATLDDQATSMPSVSLSVVF